MHSEGRTSIEYIGTLYRTIPEPSNIAPNIIKQFNMGLVSLTILWKKIINFAHNSR